MIERSLDQEWFSILSKCVYAKFQRIDFSTSHDIAKKHIFFGKYWHSNTRERELRGRGGVRFTNSISGLLHTRSPALYMRK